MRGNRIDGEDLGTRPEKSKKTFGFTLGGPIVKNKLFFFVKPGKIRPGLDSHNASVDRKSVV